jgi:REP element-mobilizing transposase RayT
MQQSLPFPAGRGGRREGAGRKRGRRVSHRGRPKFARATPVHVSVRVRSHVWNLRSGRAYRRISKCLELALGKFGLRVIEYSVLGNHLHLIVEADSSESLARGMQGLAIRIAKSLNAMMRSRGAVFADHYDGRLLTTPTQLVRAIAYVLRNHEHHYGGRGRDRFSSDGLDQSQRAARLAIPLGWLLRDGWRRATPPDLRRLDGLRFLEGPPR